MPARKVRTAILISGRGSNMRALAEAAIDPKFPAKIVLVISNNPEAPGLQIATDMGIPVVAMDHLQVKTRKEFDARMQSHLQEYNTELICCAGYMRILSSWFVAKWPNRIMNIHPSLLPKYKGLRTHERVLEAGDSHHGCTVHYVNDELDGGDVILQAKTKVNPDDTVETLSMKVQKLEHPLYIKSLVKVTESFDISK